MRCPKFVSTLLILVPYQFAIAKPENTSNQTTDRPKFKMIAIGDSISRGFNSYNFWRDAPSHSWSTGDATIYGFTSHFQKLQYILPNHDVVAINLAETGADVNIVDRYIPIAVREKPDYVTYMVGSNDVCGWYEDDPEVLRNYEIKVRSHLNQLTAARDDVRIVMVAIPDLYQVWTVAQEYTACRVIWDYSGLCAPMLATSRTPEQRQAFRGRWLAANRILKEIAEEFPFNIRYIGSLAEYPFGPEHISSYDCFHPSVRGESLLAELTWKRSSMTGWLKNFFGDALKFP